MLDYPSFQKKYKKRLWYFQRKRIDQLLKEESITFNIVKVDIYQKYPILFSSWRYYPFSKRNAYIRRYSFLLRVFCFFIMIIILVWIHSIFLYDWIYLLICPMFYLCFFHISYHTMQSTMAFYLAYQASFLYPYKSDTNTYLDKVGYGPITLILLPEKYFYLKEELEGLYSSNRVIVQEREDIYLCDGFMDKQKQFYCQYVNTDQDYIVLQENINRIENILEYLIMKIHQ